MVRSKPVVVERKKRRLLKRDRDTESVGPVKESEVKAPVEPEEDEHTLTSRERDARAEALKDAIRQAEQERMKASEERRLLSFEITAILARLPGSRATARISIILS